ncbi:MAG TPA: ATP-binding protein [Rhizomicrobium sp.]
MYVTGSFTAVLSGIPAQIRAAGRNLRRELNASLNPQSEAEVRLVDQQITIARQASWTTNYILPPAAVLISLANVRWVPLDRLIVWPLIVTIACAGSDIYFNRLMRRIDEGSPQGVRARAHAFAGITMATSFAWALMAVLLWSPSSTVNHMFLLLILASTISGWTSLGASHLASAFASMPIYLAVQFGMPLTGGTTIDTMLAFLCAGYWIIMTGLLYTNYKTRERILRLESERGTLIDDLQRAKIESDRARERAELASRAKSSFLANMSHELRTPLNAILGFSEIIHTRALGPTADAQYVEYGGFIHDSGKHLLALISDILDLAKIEAGRLILREENINLARLLSDAAQMVAMKARDGQITLISDVAADLPYVFADERALRQITVNLLSNAVKFTPPNGDVTIFATRNPDGSVRFGVQDNGIGIEPEDLARVFENFGQGRHDAVIADQGTGLGLAIVKGLVDAHAGTVSLESEPGRGTKVTVTLPADRMRERVKEAAA